MNTIRPSGSADVAAILAWLSAEYEDGGTGQGFWCNRSIIENGHKEGRLIVADDGNTDRAIAFQVGGLLGPGIREVWPDKRGMGFGRKLVEHCVARAMEEDKCVLRIQCKPASSVPFWKHMGFRLFSEAFGERCPPDACYHAFRILDKRHDSIPAKSDAVHVQIRFYAECGVTLTQTKLPGSLLNQHRIALPHRVIAYSPCSVFALNDTFVDVHVGGRELYSGKAKYPEAEAIGIQRRDGEVFIVDELELPDAMAAGEGSLS